MLRPAVHPFVNVAPEKPPMLSDFGSRQFTEARELIHRGLRNAQEVRHFRDGENLAFRRQYTVKVCSGCCGDSVVHNGYGIGVRRLKL